MCDNISNIFITWRLDVSETMQDKPTLALEVQAGVAPVDVHRAVINLDPVQQYLY